MSNILEISHVTKQYTGKTALNDVSLSIPRGSIYGLLGPNGAGKTSLIRIINRITQPDSGTVLFNGSPLDSSHLKQIGYLPEERGLYKKMKVMEQIVYFAELRGVPVKVAKQSTMQWLEKFDLVSWRNKKVEELSKGMQQKVQFIISIIHQPEFIILDEPFSGFDPVNADLVTKEILGLRDKGATILYSTHRMESVEQLCDSIALINQSEKILDGTVADVKAQFKNNLFRVRTTSLYEPSDSTIQVYRRDDDYNCILKCSEAEPSNYMLTDLMKTTQVLHFEEVIPSIHDIFISKVTNTSLYA
ncbi:MAG: ATP-binding cassette domain-containing protein [Bacteroidia bacterium]|nr:ATP-binding cassette domain-containing protein [Bacteroidia bacterium]